MGSRQLGKPEIQHLHLPARRQENIRRLNVAVDDSLGMSRVQRIGQLNRNVQQAIGGDCSGKKLLVQVLPLEQFHRYK